MSGMRQVQTVESLSPHIMRKYLPELSLLVKHSNATSLGGPHDPPMNC